MVIQWLGLGAFTVEGPGSIPGQQLRCCKLLAPPKKKLVKYLNIAVFKAIFMYIAFI